MEYDVTIDDPTMWTKPWTVRVRLSATTHHPYEFACHEGNETTLLNMLAAARAEERDAVNKE